ncbi:MAG: DNA polymerase V [Chitinophagaceae bacterium]|nr:MAG: DNA polymerase [Chitinophagaceae bacterium]TXT33862.1 MAG: DNA polymerase V [Chitinophagaceae bacterium]
MIGIVDCNSFYCSCERLFKPELANKPVVVLSNNDGCIVSRSDEAKALGVEMAGPYFMAKATIEKYGVATFSSNYNLYGDLSWRVMETLRTLLPPMAVEVYSVDECFIDLNHIAPSELTEFSTHLKDTVELWTGIKVSIGVAPTKVLSKVANRIAKKHKIETNCVLVLDTPEAIEEALHQTAVEDIWGIGRQYANKLRLLQINTAYDLSKKSIDFAHRNLGGVVGMRLIRELNGMESIPMHEEHVSKKMIATTRMFGTPVTGIEQIKEAISTYTSRVAEKLRRQHSAASTITVFVVAKEATQPGSRFKHGPSLSTYIELPQATSSTHELIKPAVELVSRLFEQGRVYKKAGVIVSNIVPDSSIQGNLFAAPEANKNKLLMNTIDNLNFAMRNDMVKFASSGTKRNWKMRQELRSPMYTSRWDEICTVR